MSQVPKDNPLYWLVELFRSKHIQSYKTNESETSSLGPIISAAWYHLQEVVSGKVTSHWLNAT